MTEQHDNKPEDDKGKITTAESPFEGDAMDRFVKSFEASARRWELVVYPAMVSFVILAAYGFFLIYSLSKDIHTLAQGMDPQMAKNLGNISDSVVYLSENIRTMTRRVDKMTTFVEDISGKMDSLENLEPMLVNMRGMNSSMGGMDNSVRTMSMTSDAMRYEMGKMGHSMRPMNFMGDFMPW
ncbi:MAG: hypothetical protein OEU51_00880 [Gammaproteobacteria bacterium]|jgi:uncharacterized protein YoxC|nr:hypothetical protein [Gammaproteobacteria bacterium]